MEWLLFVGNINVINDENIKTIEEYNSLHKIAKEETAAWKNSLKKEREKVDVLKDTLKEYEVAFNFVGLYDGFNDLKKVKVNERKKTSFYLFFMSIAILAIPISEMFYIICNINRIAEIKEFLMFSFIPAASTEILLIYFFRIFLHNQKSIKSQLLQIDLRRTLCQFIQSYIDYSKEIKSKGDTSLEKFENIIFSGIVSSDEKLPSTYDGMNQLIGLIDKIKKT